MKYIYRSIETARSLLPAQHPPPPTPNPLTNAAVGRAKRWQDIEQAIIPIIKMEELAQGARNKNNDKKLKAALSVH